MHRIVGIDDTNDLGVGGGVLQRQPQRAGLEAGRPSTRTNLKRSPSSRQCVSTGRQSAGSGVLLMTRCIRNSGTRAAEIESSVCLEHLRRLAWAGTWIETLGIARRDAERGANQSAAAAAPESMAATSSTRAIAIRISGTNNTMPSPAQRCSRARNNVRSSSRTRRPSRRRRYVPHKASSRACPRAAPFPSPGSAARPGTRPQCNGAQLPMVGIGDQAGPLELRRWRGVEQAPVRDHAALRSLPGLIEGLDDVVVDAVRIGAGHEIAEHVGLFGAPRNGVAWDYSRRSASRIGNDDAFARIGAGAACCRS